MQKFPASLEKLYDILNFVRQEATHMGFQSNALFKIELAMEETLVNIINHGYRGQPGFIFVQCDPTDHNRKGIRITIKDSGIPFDPVEKKVDMDPQSTLLKDKKVGGYGIYFIRSIMDDTQYTRENDYNVLTLMKYID